MKDEFNEIEGIETYINALKLKIKEKIRSSANPGGFLLQQERKYLDFFSFDKEGFMALLDKDELSWAVKIEKS